MAVALLPARANPPTGANTITMRVLPPAPPRWHRGLLNPRLAHLHETRNGVPRTLDFEGRLVGISVCRVLLGGGEVDPAARQALCPRCEAVAAAMHSAPERGERS
ncbi:hypothetical protein [Alloactinosynnema sp. L-07]|uniref:hypothetical protein n=1 Tax=Alloactinosynnema sp. L-07 TaxID=1653480 RepID=UPI00065F01DA|nr:hypothetical protein [Alloactinosynnema sp. L-07]CRK58670.1 hypothetical protein [Alloactinosynnema sp. L-07]